MDPVADGSPIGAIPWHMRSAYAGAGVRGHAVIFIQQGQFITGYGALTLAVVQSGVLPATATVWMLVVMGRWSRCSTAGSLKTGRGGAPPGVASWNPGLSAGARRGGGAGWRSTRATGAAGAADAGDRGADRGPMMYRLMCQPIASAPVLVLSRLGCCCCTASRWWAWGTAVLRCGGSARRRSASSAHAPARC